MAQRSPRTWPDLLAEEFVVPEEFRDELLYREAHPDFRKNKIGRITSQVFGCDRELSVARSTRVSAERAHDEFLAESEDSESLGNWAVTNAEVWETERLMAPGVRVVDDSARIDRSVYHAYIDFRGSTNGEHEKAAQRLAGLARRRGRQHPPVVEP